MKNLNFIALAKFALLCLFMASCSKSDPTPTPPTYKYVCIESANAPLGNGNIWDLNYEPAGFSAPNLLRSDDFKPDLLTTKIMNNQKSAFDKTNNIYLVATGDRVVRYKYGPNASGTGNGVGTPTVFMGGNILAMEFLGTRLFIIKQTAISTFLQEYDSTTLTPLTTFAAINLGSVGYVSNMTSYGNKLFFINGISLQSVDISATSPAASTITTLSAIADGTGRYDGLEAFNATTLYAIKHDLTPATSKFVKITSSGENTEITGLPLYATYNRPSSAYDSQTEFYYAVTFDYATNTSKIISIDLTPFPVAPLTTSVLTLSNKYVFGLQIID